MFADYLCDSPWANRPHRGWTTLFSFMMQVLLVGALLLLPLLYTQALPRLKLIGSDVIAPPPAPAPARTRHASAALASNILGPAVLMPSYIPRTIANLNEADVPPPPELPGGFEVRGGTGPAGPLSSVLNGIGNGGNPPPLPTPPPTVRPVRISHMIEGNLIHRVNPEYPTLARQARIQGTVVLRAVIDREGRIKDLQVLSGHPMLVKAAIDAVSQWRYRPHYLNEQPVEVETQVTVNFTLAGG